MISNVDKICSQLEEYKAKFHRNVIDTMRRVVEIGYETAMAYFGGAVDVGYHFESEYVCVLTANGDDVCFLEFGTGDYTATTHKYADVMPFKVEPGSWSKEHAHTYQDWIASGAKGEYPYNTMPRFAMQHAYEAMYNAIAKEAQEVFR